MRVTLKWPPPFLKIEDGFQNQFLGVEHNNSRKSGKNRHASQPASQQHEGIDLSVTKRQAKAEAKFRASHRLFRPQFGAAAGRGRAAAGSAAGHAARPQTRRPRRHRAAARQSQPTAARRAVESSSRSARAGPSAPI